MKTTRSICLFLLMLTGTLPGARGETFRTDINPALLYYQAFLVAPELAAADYDYLYKEAAHGQKLPERFGTLITNYDNQFKLVREAAQQKVPCDWGVDMSKGPATLLAHLARAKAVVQGARFRAMWDLQHDRQADARDDLLAAVALARNVSRDGTRISLMVQIASEAIVCSTVVENFGRFSPETLKQLVDGFDAGPPRGTVVACIPMEKANLEYWLLGKTLELQKANPGDDAKVMAAIHEHLASMFGLRATMESGTSEGTDWWKQLTQAAGGTSEGVVKQIRDLESFEPKLALLLALPPREYESQVEQFKAELRQSPNPLPYLLFPTAEQPRKREIRILVSLAMVRAAMEYKLRGEPGLQSVTDPCGKGPFAFRRFVFQGVDRGFELKSAYAGLGFPCALIFVEKAGPPFYIDGPHIGQAVKP